MSVVHVGPLLFSPWRLGPLELKNRIVIEPMCMYAATDGKMGPFHHMHVGNMASSGAGLVVLEATAVQPNGRISPCCCGLWSDETAQAMKVVLDEVRHYSKTPIAIQLAHAGRKASTVEEVSQTAKPGTQIPPSDPRGWQTVAPSPIPYNPANLPPHELTKEEIKQLAEDFAAAAKRADAIGLDGIQMHFAHGYLMHEFLSPLSNHRTDEYGGSLENRMRAPLEVFKAVRAVWPKTKALWVRISVTDWAEGGWDVEQSIELCKRLKELGCDAIDASSAALTMDQKVPVHMGYQLPLAKAIREGADIPTIAVGLITEPGQAEVVLATGVADAIGVARQILFNPHWPYEAAHQLGAKVEVPPQYWRGEPAPRADIFTR